LVCSLLILILLDDSLSITVNSYHFGCLRITLETYSLLTPVWKLVFLGVHNEILHCFFLFCFLLYRLNTWIHIDAQCSLKAFSMVLFLATVEVLWCFMLSAGDHGSFSHILFRNLRLLRTILFIWVSIRIHMLFLNDWWSLDLLKPILGKALSRLWLKIEGINWIILLWLWLMIILFRDCAI